MIDRKNVIISLVCFVSHYIARSRRVGISNYFITNGFSSFLLSSHLLWCNRENRILLAIFFHVCCLNKYQVSRTTNRIRFYSWAFPEPFTKCSPYPPDNNFPWPPFDILCWDVAIVLTILYIFAIRHLLLQFSPRLRSLFGCYLNSLLRQASHIKSRCVCVSRFSRCVIYRHRHFLLAPFRLNLISFIWCHSTSKIDLAQM